MSEINKINQEKGVAGGRANAAKYTHEELSQRAKDAHARRAKRKSVKSDQKIFRVRTSDPEYTVFVLAPDLAGVSQVLELAATEIDDVLAIEYVEGQVFSWEQISKKGDQK